MPRKPKTARNKTLRERAGVRLGTLFGIEVYLHASVIIIFTLVVAALSLSIFPGWHPDWSAGLSWATGVAAGLVFFASLLAHEFAHSLVALHYGLPVPRITLFLFGGVSELEDEPETAKSEFLIAIVGPLTSLALGLIFSMLAVSMAGEQFVATLAQEPEQALAKLTPLTTLLLWLGPVNILLGVFNMLPGFPLDGGRVFRAAVWWFTGNQQKATHWATTAGRILGWTILAVGVLELAGGALIAGAWLILIGWFLSSSAAFSYRQLLTKNALEGLGVEQLMRSDFDTVQHDMSVDRFVDEHLMQSAQHLWPVVRDEQLVGSVGLAEVSQVSAARRGELSVSDVMTRDLESATVPASRRITRMLKTLASRERPLIVVDDAGRSLGLISLAEIMKWLALNEPSVDREHVQFQ